MADRYVHTARDAVAGATDYTAAILGLTQPGTASGKRGYLYDLIWGSDDTAADNSIRYILQRHTGLTASSGACKSLDYDAPDSKVLGSDTYTGATLTAGSELLQVGANQRSTQRWVAAPGGEITIPNSNDYGVTFLAYHASATPNISATMHFEE